MTEFTIIDSPLSQSIIVEGHRFDIKVFRGEDTLWSLDVVNAKSTRFVCDEAFPTNEDALGGALANFENSPVEDFLG